MDRRTLGIVAVVVVVALAGCAFAAPQNDTVETNDGETATQPGPGNETPVRSPANVNVSVTANATVGV